jgi:hypothetical protein
MYCPFQWKLKNITLHFVSACCVCRAVRIFCGFTIQNHKHPEMSLKKVTKPDVGPVMIHCAEEPCLLDRHCKFTRFGYRKLIRVRTIHQVEYVFPQALGHDPKQWGTQFSVPDLAKPWLLA